MQKGKCDVHEVIDIKCGLKMVVFLGWSTHVLFWILGSFGVSLKDDNIKLLFWLGAFTLINQHFSGTWVTMSVIGIFSAYFLVWLRNLLGVGYWKVDLRGNMQNGCLFNLQWSVLSGWMKMAKWCGWMKKVSYHY